MNVLPFPKRVRILSCLVEGMSARAIMRHESVHIDTVLRLLVRVGDGCEAIHDELVRGLHCSLIEVDECWSWVGKKQAHRVEGVDPLEWGDWWVYVAVDAVKKIAISWRVEREREVIPTRALAADIRARVVNRPQVTSDGFSAYPDAFERAFGSEVDFGYVNKTEITRYPQGHDRRYAAGKLKVVAKHKVIGAPDESQMTTNRVERLNLTLRASLRRFARMTNGFSKKARNHRAAVSLFFGYYNFCRVHETLRVTPAMAAGIADHVWSIDELLARALEHQPGKVPPPRTPTPFSTPRGRAMLRVILGGKK